MPIIADVKYLVVHCSDSTTGDAEEIHHWHLKNGWDGIGYHKVITREGVIQNGRPEFWVGSHVRGNNFVSLGVCLIGKACFEDIQMHSLRDLLTRWKSKYPKAEIVGHRDLQYTSQKKTCPNFDAEHWWLTGKMIP